MRTEARGFTLIEVILALTILALASVVVYSALNTALTSWSVGLIRGRRTQVARIALDRISQQLKSTLATTVQKNDRDVAAFTGDKRSVRFVTLQSVGGAPLAVVSYAAEEGPEGRRLVYREHPWPDKDFFSPGKPWKEEEVPEIVDLEFVFRKSEKVEGDGRPEAGAGEDWNPGEGRDPPAEVEVRIVVDGAGPVEERTYRSIIPVMTAPRS